MVAACNASLSAGPATVTKRPAATSASARATIARISAVADDASDTELRGNTTVSVGRTTFIMPPIPSTIPEPGERCSRYSPLAPPPPSPTFTP